MAEEVPFVRGQLRLIDTLLGGGLDKMAQSVLGIHTEDPSPSSTPYMALDSDQQETH